MLKRPAGQPLATEAANILLPGQVGVSKRNFD
jgi:hypothetical protein